MRDWGRLRHNGHSLWWSILARNKRSVTLNLRERGGPGARAAAVRERRRGARELPARHDGEVGPRARRRPRRATRAPIYARVSGYGQTGRYRDRPGFASAGEAIGGLRYINGYPGQAPPRSGISLGDTLAAQSAFQGILLALYARDARGAAGQVVDASITDACFAMTESTVLEYEKTGFVREPTGHAAAAHRAVERLPLQGRPLGRDRGQPRHAVAAARGADGPARARRGPALRHPPRARRARGRARRADRRVGGAAHGARSSTGSSTRAAWCARRSTRPPTSHADPYFRERGLLVEHEDEVHGRDVGARRGAEAERHAGQRSARRRAGRSARTPTRCWGAGRGRGGAGAPAGRGRDLTREEASMAYRLGVDVGGTFTDLFLVDDGDHRQWRVKTPSTPADPSRGRARRRAAHLRRGGHRARARSATSSTARPWPPTPCSSPRARASA